MRRTFDILTLPIAKGYVAEGSVRIPWKNPRDFKLEIPMAIQTMFASVATELVASPGDGDPNFVVRAKLVAHPKEYSAVRFVAVVSCETDEPNEQGDLPPAPGPELGELSELDALAWRWGWRDILVPA